MTPYRDRLNAGEYLPPVTVEPEETTVADLKAMLKERGLPTTGTKDELVERLTENDDESK
jgi:hypothetical protein